ncbi:methyltransferase [Pedobacter ginsengisoli]|uniref:Methyltransferase n=1 Tax=Pedobacter ginsengisoli TaxID=363852 RepID=A0A2D1U1X5_9SPHI|nr:class I SAM-dependent methyltransferase [Pedobacter ginsengisoli]ATP55605.1 methyltransferase [Pedobacter ginsengisoli]
MDTVRLSITSYLDDEHYDSQLSPRMRRLSQLHWSPLEVIRAAAGFLCDKPGSKVIDIGSGIGKFCITAAQHYPDCDFYGIEQRKDLHGIALLSRQNSSVVSNTHFIHGDFTELDYNNYDGIYFFNSFAENLCTFGRIDNSVQYSPSLYNYYANYFYKILENKENGTRLVTYHGNDGDLPSSYQLIDSSFNNYLKMYIKSDPSHS